MSSKLKTAVLYSLPSLAVVALFAFLLTRPVDRTDEISAPVPTERATRDLVLGCTTDMATRYHIHPWLAIKVDGAPVEIQAEIGIDGETCMHPIHTHDATGKIHVESPEAKAFTLGDFFLVWGKDMQSFGTLTQMTVDGQPSTEGENLIFKDDQHIELDYTSAAH